MSDTRERSPSQERPGRSPASRGQDRRHRATPRFSRYSLWGGQRRDVRRDEEQEGAFVDLYSPLLLALLAWVALMNSADSFFTLYHLQVGGIELNPFAAALLETGRFGFVFAKSALISLALLVLCLHKNFYLARIGLGTSLATYTALVGYHLWLL